MSERAERPEPWPELLAGYADRQLDPPLHAAVEAWLAEHPEAEADLAPQLRFSPTNHRLWQAVAPERPTELAWAKVLANIQAQVPPTAPTYKRNLWRVAFFAGLASSAATLLIALTVAQFQVGPTDEIGLPALLAWAVLGEEDVEVLDSPGDALAALVVGDPIRGGLILASKDEVVLEILEPANDGMVPTKTLVADSRIPMVHAPLDWEP